MQETLPISNTTPKQKQLEALEYYFQNGVLQNLENKLNDMFFQKPYDVNHYISDAFLRNIRPPVIKDVEMSWSPLQQTLCIGLKSFWKNQDWVLGRISVFSKAFSQEDIFQKLNITADFYKNISCSLASQLFIDNFLRENYDALNLSVEYTENTVSSLSDVNEIKLHGTGKQYPKKGKRPETPVPASLSVYAAPVDALLHSALSLSFCKAIAESRKEVCGDSLPLHVIINELYHQVLDDTYEIQEACLQTTAKLANNTPLIVVYSGQSSRPGSGKCKCIREIFVVPVEPLSKKEASLVFAKLLPDAIIKVCESSQNTKMDITSEGAVSYPIDKPEQAIELILNFLQKADLLDSFHIGLHLNSHEIFDEVKEKYEPILGSLKSPNELLAFYINLIASYAHIKFLIDPFRVEDVDAWRQLQEYCANLSTKEVLISSSSRSTKARPKPDSEGDVFRFSSAPTVVDLARKGRTNRINKLSKKIEADDNNLGESIGTVVYDKNKTDKNREVHQIPAIWMTAFDTTVAPCLLTDIIDSVGFMKKQNKSILFDLTSIDGNELWTLDIAIGVEADYLKFGGLGNLINALKLQQWIDLTASGSCDILKTNTI